MIWMWCLSQLQLVALIVYISLGLYVWSRNPTSRINRSLTVFIACLAIWSFEQLLYTIPNIGPEQARLSGTIGGIGWVGMSPSFLWFVQNLTGQAHLGRSRWALGLAVAAGVALYIAHWNHLLVDNYTLMPYGWTNSWLNNLWSKAFFAYYTICVLTGLIILIRYIRHSQNSPNRRNAKRLLVFTLIGLGTGTLSDILAPIIGLHDILPPVGNAFCLIWAVALGYSIAKHRFLAISPAMAAENIIRTMSDLLILTDTKGRIVRVNRAVEKCLEWERGALEGLAIAEVFAPEELFAGRELDLIENRRVALKTRTGRGVPAILSSSRLMDEEQPIGTVMVIKDVSHLQLAEKALKISEARYRELVETINEVVFSLDANGFVTYISPSFENLTGYKIREVVGQPSTTFIHPDEQAGWRDQQQKLLEGSVKISRFRLHKKGGGFCWAQVSTKPIIVDGRVMGANGILTDITEQVYAQEEKEALVARLARAEKMEAIGTLAGAVAHDLNNVLSGLVTYPELMMLKLPAKSKLRDMAQTIKTSGLKAAAIVEDLLTLARRGVITTELVDLNQIVREYLTSPEY
ncbi:MAG: PAS domain S-box protein, partial [Desulfobacteraceae bacterium]|nr:PAS domain S-box protein [Desulfobacteraceae bacterium]